MLRLIKHDASGAGLVPHGLTRAELHQSRWRLPFSAQPCLSLILTYKPGYQFTGNWQRRQISSQVSPELGHSVRSLLLVSLPAPGCGIFVNCNLVHARYRWLPACLKICGPMAQRLITPSGTGQNWTEINFFPRTASILSLERVLIFNTERWSKRSKKIWQWKTNTVLFVTPSNTFKIINHVVIQPVSATAGRPGNCSSIPRSKRFFHRWSVQTIAGTHLVSSYSIRTGVDLLTIHLHLVSR